MTAYLPGTFVPITSLVLDKRNVRRHGARDIDVIKGSLLEFGQRRPVIVQTGTNVVLSGNGLVQAAQLLGWDTVVAHYVDDDDLRARRWAILDNKSGQLAEWDTDMLAAALSEQADAGVSLAGMGFDAREAAELLSRAEMPNDPLHTDPQDDVHLSAPPAPVVHPSARDSTIYPQPPAAPQPTQAPMVNVAFQLTPDGYDEFTRLLRIQMERHRTVDVAGTLMAVLRAAPQ